MERFTSQMIKLQEKEDAWADLPVWERPHVSVGGTPGARLANQIYFDASVRAVWTLIRYNHELARLTDACLEKGEFVFGTHPEHNLLPYVLPTIYLYDSERQLYPEQEYFYGILVDLREDADKLPHADNVPDPDRAEAWRESLYIHYHRSVAMAYVGPSRNAVYLLCREKFPGSTNVRDFDKHVKEAQQRMCRRIRRDYSGKGYPADTWMPEKEPVFDAMACDYLYLAADEDACLALKTEILPDEE